jgi:predicted PurR-regulated permease PerM
MSAERPNAPTDHDWARTFFQLFSVIGGGVILLAVGRVLERFIGVVLLLLMSAVVAFAVMPLVAVLHRRGLGRGWATLLVYAVVLLVLGAGGTWVGAQLVAQSVALTAQAPAYAADAQTFGRQLQAQLSARGIPISVTTLVTQATASVQAVGTTLLGKSVTIITGLTGAVANLALVVVLSLYLVLDAPRIGQSLRALTPGRYRRLLRFVQTTLGQVLGGYLRGQLTMGLLISVTVGLVCWALGVRFPLVLGTLAFCFELIPMLGPVLIGAALLLVAAFQSFHLVVEVAVFYVALQVLESNVLGPRITGHAVGLHPVVSILALIGGAEVAGLLGALFAVPTVALVVILVDAALKELRGQADQRPEVSVPHPPETAGSLQVVVGGAAPPTAPRRPAAGSRRTRPRRRGDPRN